MVQAKIKHKPFHKSARVLVVDDDDTLRRRCQEALQEQGLIADSVGSAEEALESLHNHPVDLALLDLHLPGMNGVPLMRKIRQKWPQTAVIMMTAFPCVDSAIAGIQEKADDYLCKPFDLSSLIRSCVKALESKLEEPEHEQLLGELYSLLQKKYESSPSIELPPAQSQESLEAGPFSIDLNIRKAFRNGEPLPLTPTELNLMIVLMKELGCSVPYEDLAQEVTGKQMESWEAKEFSRTHIYRLRKKLKLESSESQFIHTIKGYGYRFSLQED